MYPFTGKVTDFISLNIKRLENAVLLTLVGDTYIVNISFDDVAMILDKVSNF